MTGIEVELTDFEFKLACDLGRARYESAQAKYKDPYHNTATNNQFRNHQIGAHAEIGVCKHFGVYPEISGGQDNTSHDLILKGKRVDVKGSLLHDTELRAQKAAADRGIVDIYILAVVDCDTVFIKGWASHKDLVQPENLKEPIPKSPCYCLTQDDPRFHPFKSTKSVDTNNH